MTSSLGLRWGAILGRRVARGTPSVCIIGVASSLFQKPHASLWAHCCAWRGTRGASQVSPRRMWRLLLAQAHVQCVGSKHDEAVVAETMQVLRASRHGMVSRHGLASRHGQRAAPASVQVHLREASTRDAVVAAWPHGDNASIADFGVEASQSVAQWVREEAWASKPHKLPKNWPKL